MPYNHTKMEQRLSLCDTKLAELFAQMDDSVNQYIKSVQEYYNLSYLKATTAKTVTAIIERYEALIDNLTKIKQDPTHSQGVVEALLKNSESRKLKVLVNNLAKVCESLFWASTAFSLYAGIFGIALPVLIIQPVLGIAVATCIIGAMLAAGYKALSCFTELKSMSRHNTEYTNEAKLVSFFTPEPKSRQEEELSSLTHEESRTSVSWC